MSAALKLFLTSLFVLVLSLQYFSPKPSTIEQISQIQNTTSITHETCVSPPLAHSCAFYSTCLETHFHCGSTGYPLAYGEHYCMKFSSPPNLARFTEKGRAWMWDTMHCLQMALVPELQEPASGSDACEKLEEEAFSTHAPCYITSGLCSLPIQDWVTIVEIVGLNTLFGSWDAFEQSFQAAEGCAEFLLWGLEKKLTGSG
ncbi:hypothetical protein V5O48_001008 [Marasmius crinis-equi]|uniref:Uncharacterized protein n=1 Tax=Marasmius crinis-equi TaxID=585013 RepID=A0ABR3G067_9AGAR